jgi:hypothetical protein
MLKNLLLNTLRSLKQNKVNVIGLVFLTFLSTGIYTVLTSTTANISGEYDEIVKEGKLHDFTVSEYYTASDIEFTYLSNINDDPND